MICVIGGSGFIGSNLGMRLAQRQSKFSILDRRPTPLFPENHVNCDICDIDSLRESMRGDSIVHLAAEHRDDVRPVSRYFDVNVAGTKNIASVAREKGIERIVFTSTVAVYGFAKADVGEDGDINPFNEYGRTKFAAEEILREWQAEDPGRRSLTIIRPTVVFGPGNRGNVFNLLSFISSGKFLMIGDGTNRKSMAYVGNIAAFIHHATNATPGVHLYNYVDKPDLSMNELVTTVRRVLFKKEGVGLRIPFWIGMLAGHTADILARLMGRTFPVSSIRVKKFCASTTYSSSAHSVDNFVAETSLMDAINHTLESEFISPIDDAPVFYTE